METHWIYVLQSRRDNNLYIGCTGNVAKRLKMHQAGAVRSTKSRLPLELIFVEQFANCYEAYKTERFYKTAKGKRMLLEKMKHCRLV